MKISVLLPTRDRVQMVIKTLNSLYDNVSDKNRLEILLGLDYDDTSIDELKEFVNKNMSDYDIKFCISNERYGYKYLHKYINELSDKATGDWLFLWNDDSYIITENWDKYVEEYKDNFALLSPKVKESMDYPGTMFPIIPKAWFDVVGHFSLNCHNDTWVEHMAKDLNIFVYIPVMVTHLRNDYIRGALTDKTWQERKQDKKGFRSEEMVQQRKLDAQKLKEYIEKYYE